MAPKVYVTRRIPSVGMELLQKEGYDIKIWDSDDVIPRKDLVENVKDMEGLLCMLTDTIDSEVLDAAGPQLKIVATMSVGYEHINLEECKKRGIIVTNTANVSIDSVAECTIALLLVTCRRLLEGIEAIKNGEWKYWKPTWMCGNDLKNCTVGIFGLGKIGYGVAKRLKFFDIAKVIYNDIVENSYAHEIGAEFVEFSVLLQKSDFICICCNLTKETKEKFKKEAFIQMKKSAVLINTGRGGVINHDDLYEALSTGEIAYAGLDVSEPEPLPKDHKLITLSNCIITPHMGSNTWDARNDMSATAAYNVIAVFTDDKPICEVCA